MLRTAAVRAVLLTGVLGWATACSDSSGPGSHVDQVPGLPGLIVSSPVVGSAGTLSASTLGSTALVGGTIVYVSLVPGSVPTGLRATITDQATGLSVTTAVVAGGFDPVAIPASIGDTLLVEIWRREGGAPLHWVDVVRATRRPVIVRTSPPSGGRDVPLNANVVIVFSTPIDSTTLDTASVHLWRGTTPVPGTVRFADVEHLRAEFHPDALLAGQTDYQLVLSQGIRDVNGMALEAAVTIPFTTGTTAPATGLVFASVSPGYLHTCGVTAAGAAYCWGSNVDGELGNGDSPVHRATPVLVAGGLSFTGVSAGAYHTCGRTAAGTAYCWGANVDGGQLGDGTTTNRSTPVPVAGGLSFAAVSAGDFHTCGVTAAGDAYCWGLNYSGQLGDGTTTDRWSPVLVAGGLSFTAVSAGLSHTCGVTVTGAAYCWGANGFPGSGDGRLGDGTTTNRSSPVLVAGGLTFAAVSAGGGHTCGVTAAGDASCWGLNDGGALGDGTTTNRASPVLVAGGLSFAAVSAGHQHTCGVTAAGDAYCWGLSGFGELGNGSLGINRTPGLVTGGLSFAAVSAGTHYSCGVTAAGTAYCWGHNSAFQLGDGTSTDRSVPVKVAGQ